ncbi:hypothetical protein KC19_5G141700, partial [Ceratodon purpureus]
CIWLGQYNSWKEAKIVRDIATFYYSNNEAGFLDCEEGCFSSDGRSHTGDGRYFIIPPLAENLDGKAKSKSVAQKVKAVYKKFKEKQEEYRNLSRLVAILMEGTEDDGTREADVMNIEGLANGDRPLELTSSSLQLTDRELGFSPPDGVMLDNLGATSKFIISSQIDDSLDSINYSVHTRTCSSEVTPLGANNFSPFFDRHEILESVTEGAPVLSDEDSQWTELEHYPSYEAGEIVASAVLLPDYNMPASSCYGSDTGNQVQASFLQLVNTLLQENQELKQNFVELQRQFREHLSCCSGVNRATKRR